MGVTHDEAVCGLVDGASNGHAEEVLNLRILDSPPGQPHVLVGVDGKLRPLGGTGSPVAAWLPPIAGSDVPR